MLYQQRLTELTREHADTLPAIFCGVLLLFGWFALHLGFLGWALLLLPAAYVIGGYESAKEGLTTLVKEKELDVDLLMIVAALGAAALGLWQREYHLIIDGAVLILIFAISGALESYAMRRTERSIQSLMKLTQDTATVLRFGKEEVVSISQLKVGDEIIVKPGEIVPTDAMIVSGYSTLNQAAITGESIPIEKTVGDEVFAGTLNGYGALKLQVHQPPESSLIQRVIRLVEQAQDSAPPSQQFVERFERGYAKLIVIAGLLLAILPPFIWGWNWEVTIYRALTFLVVASPCALMAAIMPTLLSGIAHGARQGILFKNGAQLETIAKVKAIAFDKTGTLTTGQVQVSRVIPASGYSELDVLKIAASVEAYSEHPIGRAIVLAAKELDWIRAIEVRAIPGQGIEGRVEPSSGNELESQVIVGKENFIHQYVSELPNELKQLARILEEKGNTVVWVATVSQISVSPTSSQPNIIGAIAIADEVRLDAAIAISRLKKLGVEQIVMLTGDNEATARSVAQAVGLDQIHAELLPEDKLHIIRRLQQEYQTVAMVGDGINDAPALAQASVGIAMGKVGTDVALETADIVLMADKLEKIEVAIRLGKRAQVIVRQNIAIALTSIALLLIANFVGSINLPTGVIGHEGSTVIVTLSGLRLLRKL
ncbi:MULTISPECIES: heavy metal translocating P-type ATPase [Nostocales]|uniref:ATPase n=3 Tax=Nostocales TaxID=1161 RepID=A0A0C1R8L8_9CYAN|nr:heavy metal translocating P-type ATPase [Tolypothrix bouteillei]KAF3884033.1 heavy metal translocating P-type ATPase [Tolypothrix bouteillei VB521301]